MMKDETPVKVSGPPDHLHPFGAAYVETERYLQRPIADRSASQSKLFINGLVPPSRLAGQLIECADDEL